jgi:hypothetical protein
VAVNYAVKDLGEAIGGSLASANEYKQDFFGSEEASDLDIGFLDSVNLSSSLIICEQAIGSHFTLDHPVNGILDSAVLELDTGLGARVCPYIVINSDFYYQLSTDFSSTYKAVAGTANLDTTTARLRMSSLSTHLPKTTYQDIGSFTYDSSSTIIGVTVTASETRWNPTDVIKYYVSFDNRVTWTEVSLGVEATNTSGHTGYVRVVFIGNGNKDTYIDNLTVVFSV